MRAFLIKNFDSIDTLISCIIVWAAMQTINTLTPLEYTGIVHNISLSVAVFFTVIVFTFGPIPIVKRLLPKVLRPGDLVEFSWSTKSPYQSRSLVIHAGTIEELVRETLPPNYQGSTATYEGETFWLARITGQNIQHPRKQQIYMVPLSFLRNLKPTH